MGRHASSETKGTARQTPLLGWGLFVAVLLAVLAPVLGLDTVGALALVATAAVVFLVLYFLSGVAE